ncbi:hypothetical protein ACNOYE_09295 [Nannocystaceae bacterium ST9]
MFGAWLLLLITCASLYTCTARGRITYPDDEIVFQTTQSLWERGSLAIAGIPHRTGEKPTQATGTFGWAEGREGRRYGFFGHGLSIVALSMYGLARASVDEVPANWRRAIRGDLFTFHARGHEADWLRIVVSLTNCLVTPLAVVLLGLWARVLGASLRPAIGLALIYAFASTAWPYAGTFLSEPLSAVVLLGAALAISRWRRDRARGQGARALALAGLLAGLSLHVHLLNAIAIPCLLGYAFAPTWRDRSWSRERGAWALALGLGTLALIGLLLDQWWRFGDPFESGRYADYGRWIWPFEALLTMLVAPGRSLLIYSPPIVLGLFAWAELRRRDPDTAYFVLAIAATRLVLVACRSDWHGGWGIGPRYLVPIVPFLLLPLIGPLERWRELTRAGRRARLGLIAGSIALQGWLAIHSIFQIMWDINQAHGRVRYWKVADWQLDATPAIAFWRLEQPTLEFVLAGKWAAARGSAQVDLLVMGAWRVAASVGESGLLRIFQTIGALGLLAGLGLAWLVRRRSLVG